VSPFSVIRAIEGSLRIHESVRKCGSQEFTLDSSKR
jgi:hypothetical protein